MILNIFYVCTIFCSIQKLMKDEINTTVTNKRKFINEQNTSLKNTSINKHYKSHNEYGIIKKQKIEDVQLENNNYNDLSYLKSHNVLIFEDLNDIYEVSYDRLNTINESFIINKDAKSEYYSCDDANNFEKILSIPDVSNNEDFIYYCNQFSLELLDNINHDNNDNNGTSIHKEINDGNDTNLNLNITPKLNNEFVETFFLNILKDDITKYVNSLYFKIIFDIIFQDLLNILKISILFVNIKNEQIKNYIIYLEQQKNCEQRILAFIKVTNEMLNKNINIDCEPNIEKIKIIKSILKDARKKPIPITNFQNKIFRKRRLLINQILKNKISYKDVFDFTIENLRLITDDDIRTVCIFGLTNIIILNSKKIYNRLLNKTILLFTFNNEKSQYDINWIEKFINYVSVTNGGFNVLKNFNNINYNLFQDISSFYNYKLYIAMNTLNIECLLRIYLELQKNTSHLEFINNLIDAVNKIKCKILNIEYIKKIEHL